MRSATECAGQLFVNVLFAHPEVGELDVALLGQHDVVELQVPVHNALAVQEQESQADLCTIETRSLFRKLAFLLIINIILCFDCFFFYPIEVIKKVFSTNKFHDEYELIWSVECAK